MESIILASGSLRRQEYFKILGLPFNIFVTHIDESLTKENDPEKLTAELAIKKVKTAVEVMKAAPPKWICGADTVVSLGKSIFGKPENHDEAVEMLKKLSGKQHTVFSSVALYNGNKKKIDCRSATCKVEFAPLSEKEINWYVNTNEWQGVAGGYRLQGIASCFITQIKGTPSTVLGLPLREFYVMLRDNGYPYGA